MTKSRKRGYLPHSRGNLELDRTFRRVGNIRVTSGTKDARKYRLLDAMLSQLYEGGRFDVLRSIQSRQLSVGQVYEFYRVSQLDGLPMPEDMLPLAETVAAWLPTFVERNGRPISDKHHAQVGWCLAKLTMSNPGAVVGQLPDLLRAYRVACQKAKTPTVFNRVRAAVQAFLRERLGRHQRAYVLVGAVPILSDRHTRKAGHPQTPEQARTIRDALGPVYGAIWWGMCCTGMGQDEYWGKWSQTGDRVEIRGTKRDARSRIVPRLATLVPPICHARTFADALRHAVRALGTPVVARDARRTFGHWLEQAGLPPTRIRIYLGHRIAGVTELYLRHEVEAYLTDDRRRLLTYLGEPMQAKLEALK